MFTNDYLSFDEFGVFAVRCLSCSKTIKSRVEIPSKLGVIRELSKHADYREIPVILKDGNISFIMVCDDCKFIPILDAETERITNQLNKALRMQLEYEGKLPDMVDAILAAKNFKVLRKAEVSEVTKALRGI